jgi:hypothetical protein
VKQNSSTARQQGSLHSGGRSLSAKHYLQTYNTSIFFTKWTAEPKGSIIPGKTGKKSHLRDPKKDPAPQIPGARHVVSGIASQEMNAIIAG